MKIAIIHSIFTGVLGGGEKVAFGMANALNEEGHRVEIYSEHGIAKEKIESHFGFSIDNELEIKKLSEPFYSRFLKSTGRFTELRRAINNRFFLRKGEKLSEEKDLIIFTSKLPEMEMEFQCPTTQYIHSSNRSEEVFQEKNIAYSKIIRNIARQDKLYSSDFILFNSEYTKSNTLKNNNHLKDGKIRKKVVYPPVNSDFEFREWDEKKDRAIIVGRYCRDKKIEEAIEICNKINLNLLVAGSAEDEKYFEELKDKFGQNENIEFRKNLDWKELKKEIEASKIGFSCKRGENFGINVVEYMKAGTVPIVYNDGGPAEIVQNSDMRYETVEEATEVTSEALENFGSLRNEIRQRKNHFSREKFEQRVKSVVNSISP